MTTHPSTRVTDTTARFWRDAGETFNDLRQAFDHLVNGDHALNATITHNQEQPTAAEVAAHMHRALDVKAAAHQHYLDLRRLYVLCGGDVRPGMEKEEAS